MTFFKFSKYHENGKKNWLFFKFSKSVKKFEFFQISQKRKKEIWPILTIITDSCHKKSAFFLPFSRYLKKSLNFFWLFSKYLKNGKQIFWLLLTWISDSGLLGPDGSSDSYIKGRLTIYAIGILCIYLIKRGKRMTSFGC